MDDTLNIFSGSISKKHFEQLALETFAFQYENLPAYRAFCDLLGRKHPQSLEDIPFLPISFFKTHRLINPELTFEKVFLSSGSTDLNRSKHFVHRTAVYEDSFLKGFEHFYGDVSEYCIVAILPSYLENGDSSLIYMVDKLMKLSASQSAYIAPDALGASKLKALKKESKLLIIGVSYALLELAENFPMDLSNAIIMETGGMKGRGKELVRGELHKRLCEAFHAEAIHSEYGMTELLSQAYAKKDGMFRCPPWMQVLIRASSNPLEFVDFGMSGGINIIDLANKYSCSFIACDDLGKQNANGDFEVLGRFDNSEVRGCNLLSF